MSASGITSTSAPGDPMTAIAAVRTVLPAHRYRQAEITDMFAGVLADPRRERLMRRLHAGTRVEHRHLALPLDAYPSLTDLGTANDAFLACAEELAARAIRSALDAAAVPPEEVDLVMSTTVTGIAAPSLEARIARRAGLRPDVKRLPIFGLGCVAGAAGIARLHDFLVGTPGGVAVLLSVELCSLTMQRDDGSTANLVASGLFGDGASAVVLVGADRAGDVAGPLVLDSRSHLYPHTERTMGWDVTSTGLKIVLDAEVPDLVRKYLAEDVHAFLGSHGLSVEDVRSWVCHPGGPKVIEAMQDALNLSADELATTWRSLADVGNLSSSSVLHVLSRTIASGPAAGTYGLLMAMGPGFCSELVLLRWR
jgi:alkylresorcinol/alkylpyrone synthase